MDYSRYSGSDKLRNELHLIGPEEDFKRLRNIVLYKMRYSHKQYGSKIISKIRQSNSRKLYHTVQKIIGKKVTKVEVRDNDGKTLQPNEINELFASIYKIHPRLTITT